METVISFTSKVYSCFHILEPAVSSQVRVISIRIQLELDKASNVGTRIIWTL